ncbi:nuclear transport factor 2 family protein [Aestuariicella hydrocarbonica]|uniref:Nuclear transport factor 2 family protein n=1 Tax=Pseudomaricurvus hydrocarbonicus TaxID=1470433 RepID=A0A9E5JWH5_9GAMM|nr:nuclear transport factor 2 family protein [Aestuariicella hydrocarbonica]NHO65805.1 nuclear transport factor 2 family protein [Aestuariicella hydrocarbonica]
MEYPDHAVNDRRLIEELVYKWALARDSDDWEALSQCFHTDADIKISWIRATAETFIARSREMAANRASGMHMKHHITNNWVEVNGNRGFSRCNAVLLIRDQAEGVWFDFEGHFRFFDRLEKRDGRWGIVNRTAVYDKDLLNPMSSADQPLEAWSEAALARFPQEAKFLYWWFANKGIECDRALITAYSDAEKQLLSSCKSWLGESN